MIPKSLLRGGCLAGAIAGLLTLGVPPALAGGGSAIGKVAGDLSDRFAKVVNPTVPPRVHTPALEYRPPEHTPMGTQTWSTGRVSGATPPKGPLTGTFNRVGADRPGSSSLTDIFNHTGRGN
ncbi:MAG: hypothetical protein AAFR17_16995 [Pseudomonadota bacterium]